MTLKSISNKSLYALLLIAALSSCKEDEEVETPINNTSNLSLDIQGLEDLGSDQIYEGWIIVSGAPVSTGTFTVNANGELSQSLFPVSSTELNAASTFVLTIEPQPDLDPAPSDVHILAGDFSSSSSTLAVSHDAALGSDYSASTGHYILATPTNGMDNDEKSGVWFLDPNSGPAPGLDLPVLPAGWAYEGWAVIDGTPVSTGTFTSVSGEDNAAPYSGTMDGPPFPGEDFLVNGPSGLSFPVDLSESTIVISIEPVPDNSTAPFTLKPLVGQVPADALHHTLYSMGLNLASFPQGIATR